VQLLFHAIEMLRQQLSRSQIPGSYPRGVRPNIVRSTPVPGLLPGSPRPILDQIVQGSQLSPGAARDGDGGDLRNFEYSSMTAQDDAE
jgi:hypothetical protein